MYLSELGFALFLGRFCIQVCFPMWVAQILMMYWWFGERCRAKAMYQTLVKVFLLPSPTDITIQHENVRLLFGCALQVPHQYSLSSLLIQLLPGYECPGFAHEGVSASCRTGHHGSWGWRDWSVSVLCGSLCHCAIASKLQVTPASRMRGLGARCPNSHNFGRDTGVTIDILLKILLKIKAGVLILIFFWN